VSVLARFIQKRSVDPWPSLTLNDYISLLNYGGQTYAPQPQMTLSGQKQEEIVQNFEGVVQGALKSNGIVFACLVARAQLFSEAVFKFQRLTAGRPGDLFGTPALASLETPWPKATTADLIATMSMDADITGNAFLAQGPPSVLDRTKTPTVRRLRPDWVTIIGGSKLGDKNDSPLWQWDVEPIGYLYHPGGRAAGRKPEALDVSQVAHFTPWGPDPETALLGLSPMSGIVQEIIADKAMTVHKRMFLENGATPNMVVTLPEAVTPSQFQDWVDAFDEEHEGVMNAYKTIYFGGGASLEVVGANLQQLDFKTVQGHGETRICMALRVEPIIVGASEGLEAATYSNYSQALRAMADLTARPWWRNAAGSLAPLVTVPKGTRLWYDDRDISFLREDGKDVADIQVKQATAAKLYVDAGFEPDSVVKALGANDPSLLTHSGLVSVQLLPPGQDKSQSEPVDGAPPAPAKGTPPPPVPTKPAPAKAPVAKSSELVPYRERTDPKRDLLWVAVRFNSGWEVECPRCTVYSPVNEERFTQCAQCGATWHVEKLDNERGSACLEPYVLRGDEYEYPPEPLLASSDIVRSNGHALVPAALPPVPPPA
jgi:hypothetical protein